MNPAPADPLEYLAEIASHSGVSFLTPLGPLILAAASLGIAKDTRTVARKFDIAHALVIRECVSLGPELGLLDVEDRGDRSQRLFFSLSDAGADILRGQAR